MVGAVTRGGSQGAHSLSSPPPYVARHRELGGGGLGIGAVARGGGFRASRCVRGVSLLVRTRPHPRMDEMCREP